LFSPADDPGALAGAVMRLAGESSLRGRLRDGGLRTAARFSASSFDSSVVAAVEGATTRASRDRKAGMPDRTGSGSGTIGSEPR